MVLFCKPRVCGEKRLCAPPIASAVGSPPAYAGKSSRPLRPPECRKDHPRVCGEKQKKSPTGLVTRGSPPHVRGKETRQAGLLRAPGITPACAGKSNLFVFRRMEPKDHPRVCGEKAAILRAVCVPIGSPPRMRGKERCCHTHQRIQGITPAYAGKRLECVPA